VNANSVLWWSLARTRLIGRTAAVAFTASVAVALSFGQLRHHEAAADVPVEHEIFLVHAQPLVTRVAMLGTIEPSRIINVGMPFDGSIRERLVPIGAMVSKGQPLLVLDTLDLDARIRDSEAMLLKAESTDAGLRVWAHGPEVSRARRNLDSAGQNLATARRRLTETKALLDRGIVPRMEFDDQIQSVRGLEGTAISAQQDLVEVLAQGGAESQRIAALQLENARAIIGALQEQRWKALLLSPATGIVTRPAKVAAGTAGEVEAGVPVQRGQVLFSIADLATLEVTGRVDEFDINRVAVGQTVEVNAEPLGAKPVKGLVDAIAPQSAEVSGSGQIAHFAVRILLAPLPDPVRNLLRIGMSATTHIRVYDNPAAVIVPLTAIQDQGSDPVVRLRDNATGREREVSVTLGETTETGVEIRTGVQIGDTIVMPMAPRNGGPGASESSHG
jgi:HlyD family secretion protein